MNKHGRDFLISRAKYPYMPHLVYGVVGGKVKAVEGRNQLQAHSLSYEPYLDAPIVHTTAPRFLVTKQTWTRV